TRSRGRPLPCGLLERFRCARFRPLRSRRTAVQGTMTVRKMTAEGGVAARAWNDFEGAFGARVTRDPERLESCSWDFGGLIRRTPAMVLSPANDDDVVRALRLAGEHGLPISTRGSGHGQCGQCLASGAVVLDMRSLGGLEVDAARNAVVASAGA